MIAIYSSCSDNLIWNGYRYFIVGIDFYESVYY